MYIVETHLALSGIVTMVIHKSRGRKPSAPWPCATPYRNFQAQTFHIWQNCLIWLQWSITGPIFHFFIPRCSGATLQNCISQKPQQSSRTQLLYNLFFFFLMLSLGKKLSCVLLMQRKWGNKTSCFVFCFFLFHLVLKSSCLHSTARNCDIALSFAWNGATLSVVSHLKLF